MTIWDNKLFINNNNIRARDELPWTLVLGGGFHRLQISMAGRVKLMMNEITNPPPSSDVHGLTYILSRQAVLFLDM